MLKCCICGGKIFDEAKSNNPWPLCHRDDTASRCCNGCNEDLVIKARLASMQHKLNEVDKLVPYGSAIVILWSKDNNEEIIDMFGKSGKLVAGYVQNITKDKMYGTWGPFPIDIKENNWFIVDV